MALYIPQSILHLARSLYVRPETYGPNYVHLGSVVGAVNINYYFVIIYAVFVIQNFLIYSGL